MSLTSNMVSNSSHPLGRITLSFDLFLRNATFTMSNLELIIGISYPIHFHKEGRTSVSQRSFIDMLVFLYVRFLNKYHCLCRKIDGWMEPQVIVITGQYFIRTYELSWKYFLLEQFGRGRRGIYSIVPPYKDAYCHFSACTLFEIWTNFLNVLKLEKSNNKLDLLEFVFRIQKNCIIEIQYSEILL